MSEKQQQKPQQEQEEQQEIKKAEKVIQKPQTAIKAEKESRKPVKFRLTAEALAQFEKVAELRAEREAQRTITLVSEVEKLTPHLLSAELSPFLNAIEAIQHVIDDIQGQPPTDVLIKSISQNSPITVTLEGAVKAIQEIKDIVVPWRRKHQEKLARLQLQEKKVEIDGKKAEILERQAKAAKDHSEAEKIKAEADRLRAEAERMMLENYKLRDDFSSSLALEMLAKEAPSLSDADKGAYLAKLLPHLGVVISSGLEVGDS